MSIQKHYSEVLVELFEANKTIYGLKRESTRLLRALKEIASIEYEARTTVYDRHDTVRAIKIAKQAITTVEEKEPG